MTQVQDKWAAASAYEGFMGRWSRPLAYRFLAWLGIPSGANWLDVGCGTGALTSAILDSARPASIVGCDPAEPLLESARARLHDPRASFFVAKSGDLPRRQTGYDSVSSLLALNFLPDPDAAVREMSSLTIASGTVSACVWDYSDGMQFLRCFWNAASSLDETARDLDEGRRFPLCRRAALDDLFHDAGLKDVRCDAIEIPTVFESFDDYWNPLLGGTGPVPSYVASLDEERRAELARKLMGSLGSRGPIVLRARAWAVRGTIG